MTFNLHLGRRAPTAGVTVHYRPPTPRPRRQRRRRDERHRAFEANETFTVTLSQRVGGSMMDDATATGTITNDDKQPSTLHCLVRR